MTIAAMARPDPFRFIDDSALFAFRRVHFSTRRREDRREGFAVGAFSERVTKKNPSLKKLS